MTPVASPAVAAVVFIGSPPAVRVLCSSDECRERRGCDCEGECEYNDCVTLTRISIVGRKYYCEWLVSVSMIESGECECGDVCSQVSFA